ncbi:DsbA family protein [Nitrosomonas supralitoralis]|uniref:Disulfide bond formation protein DsbA n=1 Tax=Nitrosomonas supralitoralis TaxID=2116706 RepID=A0A2P7NQW4_9PROT|nr:DsbA family protein [Nitrosomonas supralitoralis]PSJ15855.1 disulfide bond formation protein DsbA [Nitrosomonas supralitoralis]
MKPTTILYYIHDPMCSWCYAFRQSWIALQQDLPRDIAVVNLVGGLAPDSIQPMPLATQKMVQQAWQRIELTVPEVHFNWDFWSRNIPIRSTYPSCRAVLAANKQRADAEAEMISAIQNAYYQQAMNPSLPETLQACAREIGLDVRAFIEDLTSPAIESELQHQIQLARNMDVYSYPSLRLAHNDKVFPIAIDYLNHRTMLDEIRIAKSQ